MTESQEAGKPAGPTGTRQRAEIDSIKIPAEVLGVKGACYLHVERDAAGRISGVALSSPGKFESGTLDRLFRFLNAEMEARFAVAALDPAARPADPAAFFAKHNAQRLALALALPELCDDLQVIIQSYCRFPPGTDPDAVPIGAEDVDGLPAPLADSVTDADALALIAEKLEIIAAACDALGEPVTPGLARVLPAVPQHRCPVPGADEMSGHGKSNSGETES